MNTEDAMQCLSDVQCSPERASRLTELMKAGRLTEAKQQLRCLRCDIMEELHACQRRVDLLDWLIRETEKANTTILAGRK